MLGRLLGWIVTLMLGASTVQAAILELKPQLSSQFIASVDVLPQDPSAAAVSDVTSLLNVAGEPLPFGQKLADSFAVVWLRVTLQNSSDESLERVFNLPSNLAASSMDFYVFDENRLIEQKTWRQEVNEENEPLIGRSYYIDLEIPAHASRTLLVRADSGYEPLNQSFQVQSWRRFIDWEVISTFGVGLLFGSLCLAVIVHLMQAAAYQDKTFLTYALYCSSIALSIMSIFGMWIRLFNMHRTQEYLTYVLPNLSIIIGCYFVRQVLLLEVVEKRLDTVLKFIPVIALLTVVLRSIPATSGIGFAVFNMNSICFNSLACISGVVAIVRGRELAWLYTSSFLVFSLSIIYLRLANMNVVTMGPMVLYLPAIGQILQIIILSYVMFIRGRTAYREMLTSQRNRSMNERLNLLLKIIAHDIANPLQAISLYCNMALDRVKATGGPQKEMEKAIEAVNMQARIIKHAKEAVRLMQLGQRLQIQSIAVSQIIHDVVQLFQPLCDERGIHLEIANELQEDLVMQTDPTILVHSIFGNILSNSIKFSPRDGRITMRVRLAQKRLIFDLLDHGPGISKDKRVEIFTLNVGQSVNEQLASAGSFGLSILHLCSELLQGNLDVGPSEISATGQEMGLRVTVSLPLHHAL